uniref:Uncharacterized protein n=1 Tax=Kalanchoe fedtschenkoi TaxID=63787 RepID=A0A7N0V1N2_KALFE
MAADPPIESDEFFESPLRPPPITGTNTDTTDNVPHDSTSADDWEAIADLPPEKLLAPQVPPKLVSHTLENHTVKAPKRRGRGTFSYKKEKLYSDQVSCSSCPAGSLEVDGVESDDHSQNSDLNSCMFVMHSTNLVFVCVRTRNCCTYKSKVTCILLSVS